MAHIGVQYRTRTYDLAVMEMIIGIAPKLSNFAIITAARSNLAELIAHFQDDLNYNKIKKILNSNYCCNRLFNWGGPW